MTKGTLVTINFGPFAGLSGVVISTSPERTTVRIILKGRAVLLKGRAVLVELNTDMIRVPVRHGLRQIRQRTRPV